MDEINEVVGEMELEYDVVDLSWTSPIVKEIVELRIQGYSQEEIGNKMNLTQPYISKLLNRFKQELMEREGISDR